MAAPPSHAHWAPTFPLAHWWEGWGSHFLRRSVGISQLTLQMHTQGVNALFHPKLPSWKQGLWMFRSLWLTDLKCRHTVSFRVRGVTKCLIFSNVPAHPAQSMFSHWHGLQRKQKCFTLVLFLLQQIRKIAQRHLYGTYLTSLAATKTRMSKGGWTTRGKFFFLLLWHYIA